MKIAMVREIGTTPPKETKLHEKNATGRRMRLQRRSHASFLTGLIGFLSAQSVVNLPLLSSVIQNVADPRRNGRIGKVFELAEPRFNRDMERNFRI